MSVQPVVQRPGGPQETGDAVLGLRGLQPGRRRPLLPGDDALVAEQPGPRVIGRVPAGHGLQHIAAVHLAALLLDPGDQPLEFPAGPHRRHRLAVPADLVGGHAVHAVTGGEASGGELDVATAEHRAQVGLVRGLVLAEPDVAVGPEDLRLTELRPQFVKQLRHRAQYLLLVDGLLPGPVRLGIVGLQAFVELQRLVAPPAEGHVRQSSLWFLLVLLPPAPPRWPAAPATTSRGPCPGSPRRGRARARRRGGRRTGRGAGRGRDPPAPRPPPWPGSPPGSRPGPGPRR